MFQTLSEKLGQAFRSLTGKSRLTEQNIKTALSDVRKALLDADVAFPIVKEFMAKVHSKALGQTVIKSVRPEQAFIKIVHEELTAIMGKSLAELNLNTTPPAVIMLAGLQGSGKTTTVAKLANWLKTIKKNTILLVSTDIYRPAAITQLRVLAEEIDVECYATDPTQKPAAIVQQAIDHAKRKFIDIVIIDTAGRLHIDDEMMNEAKELALIAKPIELLFVVDSMTGQDAANTANAFNESLPLTGVILTKTDGDARGGAALSVTAITKKPIKFIGSGEKIDALEPFYPERIASRILGMGDILSLVEEAQRKLDQKHTQKLTKKLNKGEGFDLADFLTQLQQLRKLGGVTSLLAKLPGLGQIPQTAKNSINDKMFSKMAAIISSMTPQERRFPTIIKSSRKVRIARGSGTDVQDVNRLLKQFLQMQKMMKRFKGKDLTKMMGNFSNLQF